MRRQPYVRWWIFRAALLAAGSLALGSVVADLSAEVWIAATGLVIVAWLLPSLWRRRRSAHWRYSPPPPEAGDSTVDRWVGSRVDPYQAASAATGAVAGLVHALAVRQVPTSELATEIVTGWATPQGIAVIDLVMGVNSGHHEAGNRWLAEHSPAERWWWAQFEVDLRHAASGVRHNALFDLTASAAANTEGAGR